MPVNKNAQFRYQILDRCFSDYRHKYDFDDLLKKVNEHLMDVRGRDSMIKERQLRDDINAIRKMLPNGVYLDAKPYYDKKCYYRYSERDFSIFQNELSPDEVQKLRSTIEMLSRYRGVPNNAWLEEVISNLEYRFGIKSNSDNVVAFEQNEQLKGLEYLSEDVEKETVILRFTPARFPYVTSKPIHKSQVVIDEEGCTISLEVKPTRELEQQILSFGPDVEVLSPDTFRAQIGRRIAENYKKYFPIQNECIHNI